MSDSPKACQFRAGFLVHCRPVEFRFLHLDAVVFDGLDGLGLVDLVRHQPAITDGLSDTVAEGGLVHFEEAQGVAHELAVFVITVGFLARVAGRGCQADLHAIEVLEHAAPLTVNRAVTFVGDDQIKVAGRIITVDVDHALQRGDGEALGVIKPPPGAQHIARQLRQIVGESILGLVRQRDAVDQK